MSRIEERMIYRAGRALPVALLIGVLGTALWILGLVMVPERAMYAYLAAFCFVTSVGVGALMFLQCCYAVNGRWTALIRRLNEAVLAILWPAAVMFVPVIIGSSLLYPWLRSSADLPPHLAAQMAHRAPYLNLPFFVIRGVVFFALFIGVAYYLRRWSRRRDQLEKATDEDPETALSAPRVVASVALPLVGLALTFASYDWIMSLHTGWYSTMFGIYVFTGGFVAGVGAIAALAWGASRRSLSPELSKYHIHGVGRLVFGLTVLWAYSAFFQAMLMRSADLPREVDFYAMRITNGWGPVTVALIVGHFAIPFFLLLPRSLRMIPAYVGAFGLWQLAFHYIDIYWLVIPEAAGGTAVPGHWVDLAALAAVAGLSVAWAVWRQRGKPLLAAGDPFLPSALEYRSR